MAWVKLHTDIIGDPKLMRAARKGAKGLEWTPWLIAFAKKANDNGRLTVGGEAAEPEDMASGFPGAKSASVAACLASLKELGVLAPDADGVLRFTAWDRRAGKPSDRPESVRERVAQHRQKKQGVSPAGETPAGANGNAEEESGNADVTRYTALQGALRNATEVEEEGEVEAEGEGEVETTTPPPRAGASEADPTSAVAGAVARATASFPDVAAALTPPDDPDLLARFLAAVAEPTSPDAWNAHVGFLGRAQRALGMGGAGMTAADMAEAVREYVVNLATGAERTPHAGRFAAYFGAAEVRERRAKAGTGRPGGKAGDGADADALRLLEAFEAAGLTVQLGRAEYQQRVDQLAPSLGYEPGAFRALVQQVKPWSLGRITYPPERRDEMARRLRAATNGTPAGVAP